MIIRSSRPLRRAARGSRFSRPQTTSTSRFLSTNASLAQPHAAPASSSTHASSSTVSASEVSHFDALASSWWDPHGSSRLLHLMNPLRHTFIAECLAAGAPPGRQPHASNDRSTTHSTTNTSQGLSILDVGCGGGIFAESAARLPHVSRVTGLDPSGAVLHVARTHARRDPALGAKLTYQQGGIETLTTRNAHDVVTLFEVVEHVENPAAFLAAAGAQVAPGGWLVGSTIARTWTSWATTKLAAEALLRVVPWGTHDWAKYVNEDELREWFLRPRGPARATVWERPRAMGVVYVPGLGLREVPGGEQWGNYFFAFRKKVE